MDEVLWKYKRVQSITLVYRVLVISLQLIKRYDVPDGEEDERGGEQQRQHIAEGCESERYGRGGAGRRARARVHQDIDPSHSELFKVKEFSPVLSLGSSLLR
ncbi:hypothetical protein NN561_017341 [Cricetulus griseus]